MSNAVSAVKKVSGMEDYQVLTGTDTRWSYAFIMEPRPVNGGDLVYSMTLLIPKTAVSVVNRIHGAIRAAYTKGLDKLKGKDAAAPALEALPDILRDGDLEYPGDPAYAGCWFLRVKSSRRPAVRDRNNQPIVDPDEVYSGCYGPALIEFFAYNHITRGIGCSLIAAWKYEDGERLGRSVNVDSVFAAIGGDADAKDFLR